MDFLADGVRVSEQLEGTAVSWGYYFVGAREGVEIAAGNPCLVYNVECGDVELVRFALFNQP